jgi:hypothetical protein
MAHLRSKQRAVLGAEVSADPLARGYSGMTDQQVADDINTAYRKRNREAMTGSEILQAVVLGELAALTDAEETTFWGLLGIGEINPFGVERDILVNLFGSQSSTVGALASLRQESISRAQELGLPAIVEANVAYARS